MTLPLVDTSTLSANPKFNALHQDLCNNKLSTDATSKLDPKAQREREILGTDFRKARIQATKRDLIQSGLQDLSYRADAFPEELQELVGVIAAVLEGKIAEEDKYLLQDDLAKFKENVKPIVTALLNHFQKTSEILATLIRPEDPPELTDIPDTISQIQSSISSAQSATAASRTSLAKEAGKLIDLHRQILETSIRILEQTMHGSVARGTKAKADYLAVVAEGMSKKLSVQHAQLTSHLYSPEIQEALDSKAKGTQTQSVSLKRKIREAEEKLEEYKKNREIAGMAKEYAEISKESERLQEEIAKLENG